MNCDDVLGIAHSNGYGTITRRQAQTIAEHVERWGTGDHLEVVLFAAHEAHTANLATIAASMVDDPGVPSGFENAEKSEWYPAPKTGILTRYMDLEVPARCPNGFVKLAIIDEIIDRRVVRRGPVAEVAAEGEFTRADLFALSDALLEAARMLPAD